MSPWSYEQDLGTDNNAGPIHFTELEERDEGSKPRIKTKRKKLYSLAYGAAGRYSSCISRAVSKGTECTASEVRRSERSMLHLRFYSHLLHSL